jgi:hypothetical protein
MIKGYINALRSFHVECGWDDKVFSDPYIELVIWGAKRLYGEGNDSCASRSPMTFSNDLSYTSHLISTGLTSGPRCVSDSRDFSAPVSLHGMNGTPTSPQDAFSQGNIFTMSTAPLRSPCHPQRQIRSPLALISTWQHPLPPSYAQSPPCVTYMPHTPWLPMLQPSHVSSGLFRVSSSSIRSANASYVPASPPVIVWPFLTQRCCRLRSCKWNLPRANQAAGQVEERRRRHLP